MSEASINGPDRDLSTLDSRDEWRIGWPQNDPEKQDER